MRKISNSISKTRKDYFSTTLQIKPPKFVVHTSVQSRKFNNKKNNRNSFFFKHPEKYVI